MAQKTSWAGAVYSESDTNTYLMHEGGAWSSYTPVVVQSNTPGITNTRSRYGRAGRRIHGYAYVTLTGSGTAANIVTITVPAAQAASSPGMTIGAGWIFDASTGFTWFGEVQYNSSTSVNFLRRLDGAAGAILGTSGFTAALAAGDIVHIRFDYEATS